MVPKIPELSEAKRALLEKYLRGELPEAMTLTKVVARPTETPVVDPRTPLTAVQTGGSKRPFFYLHGDWTGSSFFCFNLARGLGADQPFYMLDPYVFDGLPDLPTLEEQAAAHLKVVRAVQPEGPYQLGGFCNGGITAYEMARQLCAEGEKVELLVLMDSIPPRLTLVCNVIRRVGKLLRVKPETPLNWFLRLQHFYRYLLDRKAEDFEYLKTIDPKSASFFPPVEALRREYPAMFIWATADYVPSFYPGKVTLFWDEAEPVRRAWWQRMAQEKDQEVEVHIIPGTHATCKTDQLQGMAEHLRGCLEKVWATVL